MPIRRLLQFLSHCHILAHKLTTYVSLGHTDENTSSIKNGSGFEFCKEFRKPCSFVPTLVCSILWLNPVVPPLKSGSNSGKTLRSATSGNNRGLIAALFLAAGTLVLYNPIAHANFINFDDDRYVYANPHVLQGFHWKTIAWAFASVQESNWHPLTWLSHALDSQIFGLNPAGHHYVNVLFHACNAVLLFIVLKRATKFVGRSFVVAALFAVHPLNVESVAWIAERKNVLCTLFFLLTLFAYLIYARRPSLGRYLFVACMFSLGLMAKPMVVTLPFVLLLFDYWPLQRISNRNQKKGAGLNQDSANFDVPARTFQWLLLEKAPLLLLAIASSLVTLVAQRKGGAVSSTTAVTMGSRIGNAFVSYWRYIEKTVVPIHLAPLYPYPTSGLPPLLVVGAILELLGITVVVFVIQGKKYLRMGWLWFLGTLVPVIGLVQIGNQAMADRYAYIPLIGLFILAVWGAADLADKFHSGMIYTVALVACIIAGFSLITENQLAYWRDSIPLWSHTVAVTRNNFVAEDNFGNALALEGKDEEALSHFQAALRIKSDDPVAELNIGVYDQRHHQLQPSVGWFQNVLGHTMNASLRMQAYTDMGASYRMLGDYAQAQTSYQSSLELDSSDTGAIVGLGLIAQKNGDLRSAIESYSRAVAIQPTAVGYLLLSQVWQKDGHPEEAQAALRSSEKLSRDFERTQRTVELLISE